MVDKRRKEKLKQADIIWIKQHTNYDEDDIREWHAEFIKECPSGKLSRKKVTEIYKGLGMTKSIIDHMVDQIFAIFDRHGNGRMEFRDFVVAAFMSSNGTAEEKLRWQFKLLDRDGSGTIEVREMTDMLLMIYENSDAETGLSRQECMEKARQLFKTLDIDGNGEVSEDEFITGCLADQGLMERVLRNSDAAVEEPIEPVVVTTADDLELDSDIEEEDFS